MMINNWIFIIYDFVKEIYCEFFKNHMFLVFIDTPFFQCHGVVDSTRDTEYERNGFNSQP